MKEQWTKDLHEKMKGYEVPAIPEGLWEDIDAAMTKETPAVARKVPLTSNWRKACAAILLLLLIPSTLYFLHNKDTETIVAEVEKHAPKKSLPAKDITKHIADGKAETAPTLPPVLLTAKNTITLQTNTEVPPNNISKKEDTTASANTDTEATTAILGSKEDKNGNNPTPQTKEQTPQEESITAYSGKEYSRTTVQPSDKTITQPSNRISLAMNASGFMSSQGDLLPSGNRDFMASDPTYSNPAIDFEEATKEESYHEEKHYRPLTIGLQVGIPVTRDWTLATGLSYTYLHSEIYDGSKQSPTYTNQELHFVGIPVQMNYKLYGNRTCNIYLGAGGSVDFGVSGKANNYDLSHLPVNYSLKASSGIQLNILKSLNAYAEPSIQYNLPGSTKYKTYFTEHKTMFDLQLGLRWTME